MAEQLICNQWVGGSIPFAGSKTGNLERYPRGQREQTVNLPAQPSEVRILPSPPCDLPMEYVKEAEPSIIKHKISSKYLTASLIANGVISGNSSVG